MMPRYINLHFRHSAAIVLVLSLMSCTGATDGGAGEVSATPVQEDTGSDVLTPTVVAEPSLTPTETETSTPQPTTTASPTSFVTDTPVPFAGVPTVVQISAGGGHNLALMNDGTVWYWGYNGNIGLNGYGPSEPVQVENLSEIVSISAGDLFALALDSSGVLWAWGLNRSGQLGDGTTDDKEVPVQVLPFNYSDSESN